MERRGLKSKGDAAKLAVAAQFRREGTLSIRQVAQRLRMWSWNSLDNKLYLRSKAKESREQ